MKMFRDVGALLIAAAMAFVGTACSQVTEPTDDFALTTLAETEDATPADVDSEKTWVIRDQSAFQALWDRLFARRTDRPMPAIDFATQMIVVATMGPQPTAGYAVKITGVRRTERGLVVLVTTSSPGPNCVVAQVRTFPTAVSRLRKTDRPLQFEFTRRTRDCTGQ